MMDSPSQSVWKTGRDSNDYHNWNLSDLVNYIVQTLRERAWIVVLCALALCGLGVAYSMTSPLVYRSTATISIDPRNLGGINNDVNPSVFFVDKLVVDSEIEKIRSSSILRRVALREPFLNQAREQLEITVVEPSESAIEAQALEILRQGLTVEREDQTFVISITYEAADPEHAAGVANEIAQRYIQSHSRVDQSERAAFWLREQLGELTAEMRVAEADITAIRTQHAMPEEGAIDQVQQEITENNRRIIEKRSEIAQTEADLNAIELALTKLAGGAEIDFTYLADSLDSQQLRSLASLIGDLRLRGTRPDQESEQQLNLGASLFDRYRNELEWLQTSRENTIEIVNAELSALNDYGSGLANVLATSSASQNELTRQERALAALRAEEQVLLERLQSSLRSARYFVSAASIIDTAQVPLKPINPSLKTVAVVTFLGGALIGLAIVFLLEQIGDGMRRSDDLLAALHVPFLGTIPVVSRFALRRVPAIDERIEGLLRRRQRRTVKLLSYASYLPRSRFAETLRRIVYEIDRSRTDRKIVAIVSSLRNEGKSVLSANLAFYLAASGRRVLLVDGDRHRQVLTKGLWPVVQARSKAEKDELPLLRDADHVRIVENLYFLSVSAKQEREWFGQKHIEDLSALLVRYSSDFDVVLIDTPALAYVGDALEFAPLITDAIATFAWGRSSASVASRIMRANPQIREKVRGACLSLAPEKRALRFNRLPVQDYY